MIGSTSIMGWSSRRVSCTRARYLSIIVPYGLSDRVEEISSSGVVIPIEREVVPVQVESFGGKIFFAAASNVVDVLTPSFSMVLDSEINTQEGSSRG